MEPNKPYDDEWLTTDEVAARLKVSRKAIYDRLARGTFPEPRKLGTLNRWRRSAIDAWLDEQ